MNLYIVNRILSFPINLFTEEIPYKVIFLRQIVDNFLDISALIITRIVTDYKKEKKDRFTLPHFWVWLMDRLMPEFRIKFEQQLGSENFIEKNTDRLVRIKKIRDIRIGHIVEPTFRSLC